MSSTDNPLHRRLGVAIARWFDTAAGADAGADDERIDALRTLPFAALHLACIAVIWTGASTFAVATALVLYVIRMFALTGFYHRYFSHRAFRTSRGVQFAFAALGATCVQRGPLWWAAHHRNHHRHADTERDPHSPVHRSFLRSHMGWFLTPAGFRTDWSVVGDLARYPELRLLDRFDIVLPVLLAVGLYALGSVLAHTHPELGTSGAQLVVWGFCISTVVLFHATFTINSLAHRFGSRRFHTRDESRNNALLALITLGEGWHNNHHHFPGSARQGFRWWELDVTYLGLRALAALGLIRDLKPVPPALRRARREEAACGSP